MNLFFLLTIGLIVLIIIYAVLCSYTTYPSPSVKLNNEQKSLLYSTNIFGFGLGILLTVYEVNFLYEYFGSNMFLKFTELILMLVLIYIAFYANIFQDSVNDGWGKVSAALWPLLTSFSLIATLCLNAIFTYYKPSNTLESDEFIFGNNNGKINGGKNDPLLKVLGTV